MPGKTENRSRVLRFFACLTALLLLCIAPMLSDLYAYNRNTVTVLPQNVQYVSVKNTVVSQQIYCQGHMENLGITFYAPSGALYQDATVRITVSQGTKSVSETVKAAQLRTQSAYRVDEKTQTEAKEREEMTYFLRGHLFGFSGGEATVMVTGENLPEGTDLFCEVSSTKVSGLPAAKAGENDLGEPLVLQYGQFRLNAHFWYESALLLMLAALIVFTSYLLVWKSDWLKRGNLLFWCAFAIIFVVVSIRNPYASFWGEPRSEAAYEFWYKAENMGFVGSLMSLMSGEALAWWERILMWTANTIAPTKYVFTAAQLLELTWISMVTAMPCLRSFRRYFADAPRLFFSILLGTALLFDSAYYFWSCSYWALLFFILFALLPLEKLHPAAYAAGLVLTVILCVSRIYHILLIPVALVLMLVLGKARGRRFTIYCGIVAAASFFEGAYSLGAGESLAAGSSPLQSLADIGVGRMIDNTLYYQVQVINSFFTGAEHFSGSAANLLGLLILGLVVLLLFWEIYRQHRAAACMIGALGFISLGSIAVNVYTCGSHAAVYFPINYAAPVHWGENYYQQADLHFTYAYVCLVFLLAGILYLFKTQAAAEMEALVKPDVFALCRRKAASLLCVLVAAACCCEAAFSVKPRLDYSRIVVEWKSIWQITEQQDYFAAINMFYLAAPISLEQGTDEMIYGVDQNGALYQWDYGKARYQMDLPYSTADIGAVSAIGEKQVLSITACRAITNFDVSYVAVLRDAQGNELARAAQAQTDGRLWLDFLFPDSVRGVYSVTFELSDGSVAYVQDAIQVGYIK